ncbi:MAG: lipocalin family protein [Bacteroidetes bacterium]|jgi:hypothetical protein|nr:lipocalin family protein [Bacteroidota bacterium]
MRKLLILIPAVLMFATCKKDNKPIDVTGSWSLYSWDDNSLIPLHVNANQYPCMEGNVLTFNKDQTYTIKYIGTDTCFVAPHSASFPPTGTWIGMPGQAEVTGTWSQNGNTVTWGGSQGVISTSNGKTFITLHTPITYSGVTYDIKTVEVKQ